jgi:hypothetical protein
MTNTKTPAAVKPAAKPLNANERKALRVKAIEANNEILESYALGTGATRIAAIFAAKRNFTTMLSDTSNTTAAVHLSGLASRLGGSKFEHQFTGVPSVANMSNWLSTLNQLTEHITAKRTELVQSGKLKSVHGVSLIQLDACSDAIVCALETINAKRMSDKPMKPKSKSLVS